jgi:hypothetical protein
MEHYLFSGNYSEGIRWIEKEKSKKKNLAQLNQYEGDFYKLKGDLEEALVHWKESKRIRSKFYKPNDYHLAWNYALLSNYYFEKIETGLAKKYADSCAQLIQHLTPTQKQEIEIFKIWNILAQSNKLYFQINSNGTEVLRKYKWIRDFYSKSKSFILENNLPKYYLAKTYHLIGNTYHDNIHTYNQIEAGSQQKLEALRNAMSYYSLANETWTKNYGLVHHERAKTLYLMGLVNLIFNKKILPKRLTISSKYFDQAIGAFGIDLNTLDENSLKRIPNKEDALQCLRFKNETLFQQIEELNKTELIHSSELISRQAVKLWEITYDEFKSNNTNQLLGIYNLVPFKDVIHIETLKRKHKLDYSLERIFNANQKLKYFDFTKNSISYKSTPISIKTIQSKLKNGELFLDFLSNQKNDYFALCIEKKKVVILAMNSDITWFISQLNKSIIDINFKNYVTFGSTLSQVIFPNLNIRKFKKLIVCPEGEINKLVFETLLCTPKNYLSGDYRKLDFLIKHIQIEYTLSPGIYMRKKQRIPLNITAFAPFNKNKEFAELPFSTRLIENLKGKDHTVVFKNQKATAEHFLNTKTPILHFSGHGLVDSKSSSMSSLVFSNRRLSLTEISNIRSPKLIVLNACNTSNGKIIAGDGVDGFVRAFHAAGASVTIANLWEVDDKVSNELFLKFYAAMKSKKQIASLMQDTKLDYIARCSGSEMAAPYYWAGHRVMGNGEIVENARSTSNSIFWIAGLFILALCILGACRMYYKS